MSTTNNLGLFKHDNPSSNTDQFDVDKALNQNWDKVDTAIGKDRGRITTLETDNTTNKKDITDIKAKNTDQDKYISELEAENSRLREDLNGLPKGQVSGETIDLSGSAEMRCDLKISGNSVQNGEPTPDTPVEVECCGSNIQLFDKDNITVNKLVNGNGVLEINNSWNSSDYIKVDSNEYYTFSKDKISKNQSLIIVEYDEDKNFIKRNIQGQLNIYTPYTVQLQSNTRYVILSYNNTFENIDFKFEKGKIATPHSPYGQGCINEVVCNKNLCNFGSIQNSNIGLTNNLDKNIWKISGTSNANGYTIAFGRISLGKFKAGTYSFSWKYSGTLTYASGGDTSISLLNKSLSKIIMDKALNTENKYSKFILTEDTEIALGFWNIGSGNVYSLEIECQLELSETNTEIVEHQSQTYTIPTQQPFRAIEDIRDTFVKKDNKWFERHYIARKVFDGTEEIGILWNTGKYGYNIKISDMKMTSSTSDKSMILSNMYKVYAQDDLFNLKYPANGIACRTNKNEIIIRDDNITTLSDLITNLSTNKPYVDYILETPLDIECTEEQSIILDQIENEVKTYKNVTHMYSTDKISSYKEVTYKQDLETRLNNIEQAILSQGGNI